MSRALARIYGRSAGRVLATVACFFIVVAMDGEADSIIVWKFTRILCFQ
jgi:hypothetical protein